MKPSLHPPTHSTTIPNTRKSKRTRHDLERELLEEERKVEEEKKAAFYAEQDIDFHESLDGFGFSWSWRYIALFSDWSQSDQGDLALVVSFRPLQK